ncbi:hypothetical protein DI270_007620 [Microbispora triticiradicis]|uniref:SAV-6107-like HEPN domain-containing protein n=1 Tax=Microbispora triticiradicis TaxID=2200763 RepID=A0ABX9LNN0_9ACTN|nr:hypothetical protein [Microbispora triticiradicis]RGA05572.1 hypothetical protein DI270_007620 [Microbispora triticiradicis]
MNVGTESAIGDAAGESARGSQLGPLQEPSGPPAPERSTLPGAPTPATVPSFPDTFAGPEAPDGGEAERLAARVAEVVAHARHADYAASAALVCRIQRGHQLTSEPLYSVVYSHALRTWWEQVPAQISENSVDVVHAVRRVRAWARHHLTGEPAAARPGTLFDHALAHASRAAARHFLAASGELLASRADAETATAEPSQHQNGR